MRLVLLRMIGGVCRIASALVLVSLLLLGSAAAQSELEDAEAVQRLDRSSIFIWPTQALA